jgi:alpha-beta hydrolase superfamily lysophospholipase
VSAQTSAVPLRTLDGLRLAGTLVTPDGQPERAVLLVHGGGVTREEGGFFTRLADGLAEAGAASLRFDLRGHGDSEGRQEELTLATILNDVRVALSQVRDETGAARLSLLGASFSGVLGEITAPTLIVHGTKDTFVPIDASREALALFRAERQLVEIEGSQHGFAVHDDPEYLNPQSRERQAFVIRTVAGWITASL